MKKADDGLLSAVMMGERTGIQKWLARGASLHAVNKLGKTALMLCSNIEILDWLIAEGVAFDARDKRGCSALLEAAEQDNPEIVRLFLAYNAETGIVDSDGNTALSFSILRGLNDVVTLLTQQAQ